MAELVWSERFSVNIREVDDQHQRLVRILNTLSRAMREGRGKEELKKIFDNLVSYTATHFATEERLMAAHGYPEYEAHRQVHEKMTQKVLALKKEFEDGTLGISIKTLKFLEDWVEKHILGTDKKYGPFLNQKGVF